MTKKHNVAGVRALFTLSLCLLLAMTALALPARAADVDIMFNDPGAIVGNGVTVNVYTTGDVAGVSLTIVYDTDYLSYTGFSGGLGNASVQDSGGTESGKFLTFRCGQQVLGVDISEVRQIIQLPQFTPLPDSPADIKGIICMHGEAIPVMDLNLRLNLPETIPGERTCVIVFTLEERSFGIIVDEVDNVEDISEDEILPPPGQKESGTDYLLGIVGRDPVILLANADFFISADDIERLSQIADADG